MGKCFEHRRQWLEDRILLLASIFAVDVCAYEAVKSNHHHVVLRINIAKSQSCSDSEVCEQWHKLFKDPLLAQKYLRNESPAGRS